MLQWTRGCLYLFESEFSFSLEKYPEMELLDCMVVFFLIFWATIILFCRVAKSNYNPTNSAQGSSFPHPHQHLLFLVFLMTIILTGVRWCLTVVLIYISLMISDVEHLFMHQLAICISSWKKCLVGSLPIF